MSKLRIASLLVLLLSALALASVMQTPSTAEAHASGLPDAAEPDARVRRMTRTAASELPSLPDLAMTREAELEARPLQSAVVGAGVSEAGPDGSVGPAAAVSETASRASVEELREFRAYVSSSLAEIRHEEAAARLEDLEQQAASMGLSMSPLVAQLELTAPQASKMESVLLSQLDVEAEYWRQWEQGADGEILAELKVRDRAAHIDELSRFLTPGQLATYLSK